jgi:type IV pilus assembly protein PilW
MMAIMEKEAGVTLIELMIVLAIATFLVAGIYSLFITQSRSYSVQDQVTGVQQDARAALDIMARDIRMAGLAVGYGSGGGFTDGTSSIAINGFNYAVNPVNSNNAPDTLTVVLGAEALGSVLSVTGTMIQVTDDGINPKNVDYYFKNSSGNPINEKYYIGFDQQPGRLYQVSSVSGTDIIITNFPSGSTTTGKAYGVQAITYSVTAANGSPGLGVLRRNENAGSGAQALAGDEINTFVEDLQFAYQVADDTGWYNDPSTDFPAGKTRADIRMVRINISVRTAVQDATVQDSSSAAKFNQPQLEDHTAGLAVADGFRRRVYTTEVKIRNLK